MLILGLLYEAVIVIGVFTGTSDQVGLGFLIQRQACSSSRAHLPALYDCQPAKFNSVSACIDERVVLRCTPNHYIVVYTAEWQSADSIPGLPVCSLDHQLPGTVAAVVDCALRRPTGPCVLQSVSERCEGKRRCVFDGTEDDLEPPCPSSSSAELPPSFDDRLAVTYACLPKLVIRDINYGGRMPAGLCPSSVGTSPRFTDPVQPVPSSGNASTDPAIGIVVDSESQLHGYPGAVTPATQPSDFELVDDEAVTNPIEVYDDWKVIISPYPPAEQALNPASLASLSSTLPDQTTRHHLVVVPQQKRPRSTFTSGLVADWLSTFRFLHENREKAVVYALLSLSVGIIILLVGALAILYRRCRPLAGASRGKRPNYAAVSISEPEPEMTPSVSSQPSPLTDSNNWSQAIKRVAASDALLNGKVCRDRSLTSTDPCLEGEGLKEAPMKMSGALPELERTREHGGGEVAGVDSGLDGLRQPPSGMSSFSINDLHSSPSDCPSEATPPPSGQGSTATVLARYWPPPDGQPGQPTVRAEGIQMTTTGGGRGLPPTNTRYSGPTGCHRVNHPGSSSEPMVKSVHFNTVHNCEQLVPDRTSYGSQLSSVEEAREPGCTTSALPANVGQSLPGSVRFRTVPADCYRSTMATVLPSTPTATITRHYAAQPRTMYRPCLDAHSAAALYGSGSHGCPGNGPRTLSPQCTVSDDGCITSTPASRLRHYCV